MHGSGEIRGTVVSEGYGCRGRSEPTGGLSRRDPHSGRIINRARIRLKTDEGRSASQVTAALDASERTVFRTHPRYAEYGLESALHDHPQAYRNRKLDDRGETHSIALACRNAPEGHDHRTRRLLADRVGELPARLLSHETVRLRHKPSSS